MIRAAFIGILTPRRRRGEANCGMAVISRATSLNVCLLVVTGFRISEIRTLAGLPPAGAGADPIV
jgi:hypothetical protein